MIVAPMAPDLLVGLTHGESSPGTTRSTRDLIRLRFAWGLSEMAAKHAEPTLATNQVVTTGLTGPEAAAMPPTAPEVSAVAPASTPAAAPAPASATPGDAMYPPQGPDPQGTNEAFTQQMAQEAAAKGANAPGVEAEEHVW